MPDHTTGLKTSLEAPTPGAQGLMACGPCRRRPRKAKVN
jgi:hypothetical protein